MRFSLFLLLLFCSCSWYNPFTASTYKKSKETIKPASTPDPIPGISPSCTPLYITPTPSPISPEIQSLIPISGSVINPTDNIALIFNTSLANFMGKIKFEKGDGSCVIINETNITFILESTYIENDTIVISPKFIFDIERYFMPTIEEFKDSNNNIIEKQILIDYYFDVI